MKDRPNFVDSTIIIIIHSRKCFVITWKHIFKTCAKINTFEISLKLKKNCLNKKMYWRKDIYQ